MTGRWVVRLPTWLGDTVMALPMLRRLSGALSDRLVLWGPGHFEPLLAGLGLATPYISYRRRRGVAGLGDMRKAIAGLRQNQPDGALLLPNAFEPALLSTLAGIPQRVGYATDGRGWLLTQAVEPPPAHQATHEMDRFAGLLAPLEIGAPDESDLRLSPSPDIDRRATAILPEQGEVLGLVPGAANGPAKRWPARFYGGLASACAERLGAQAALLGGPTDRVVARKVRESSHSPCINLVGSDLLDLAAALCRCRVVVSNDTGAAHLAAALGRPTIVLFGPTDPARTCPRGERVQLVSAHASCQPCLSQECPLDHRCMERLSVETVFQAVADLWDVAA